MASRAQIERLADFARTRGALMDDVAGAAAAFSTRLQYPRVFRAFVERHIYAAFDVGGVRVYSNVQGEEDSLEDLLADKILTRQLVNAGFLPFGRPATGSYDRICFDVRAAEDPQDAPVVLMDHEAILSNNRIPKPKWIADGIMELLECESPKAEPVAPHEPPPRASVSDAPDDRTLDSLPAPGSSGGR